jgi:hypothetical protein
MQLHQLMEQLGVPETPAAGLQHDPYLDVTMGDALFLVLKAFRNRGMPWSEFVQGSMQCAH